MTLSINANTAAMAALESLSTTTARNANENQASTGKKVSTLPDNPAIYAISQSMTGNIADLAAVSDSLPLGAQVVNTANTAASGIDHSTMQSQVGQRDQRLRPQSSTPRKQASTSRLVRPRLPRTSATAPTLS